MRHLSPHSKEWFVALSRLDPQQAGVTKKIVKAAGAEDVCSLCGDRPAIDYEVADKWFDPATPVTLRLCEDCLSIRATNEGERLTPLSSAKN
jgi:molybdenum cofactor biosynthesis enzyme MoaA